MKNFLRLIFLLIATSMMMATLNAQTILCVDRDFGSSPDSNFTDTWYMIKNSLDVAGYDYEYWEVLEYEDDGPDATYMGDFDVVIWFTGEAWTDGATMTPNDEFNLSLYQSLAGGKLFLNAQDWLYDRYQSFGTFSPGEFPYDNVGIVTVEQDVYHIEEGQGIGDSATFVGSPGSLAEGLVIPTYDIFTTPDDDGLYGDSIAEHLGQDMIGLLSPYSSPGPCAIQYETSVFRTVFTTMDVAAIRDTVIRDILVHRIIDWLLYGPTGQSELNAAEAELLIKPNPVSSFADIGMLYIMDELSIYNNQGQLVRHEEVGRNSVRLDLSDLPTGMYVLQVKSAQGITTSKMIKQ